MYERQKDRYRLSGMQIKSCGSEMIENETASANNHMGIAYLV